MKYFLAIDIGATSGRHIIGWKNNGEIETEELYRFENIADEVSGHLIWDVERLFAEIKNGIKVSFAKYKCIESISIDTFGVDYVLMNGNKEIFPCYAYRDNRTEVVIKQVHDSKSFDFLYSQTGVQYQQFNSIYQLFADLKKGRLDNATDFLMLPEYFNFLLTGKKVKEYTNATTTGLVNAMTKQFDKNIINCLELPEKLFPNLHNAGEKIGLLLPEIAQEVGGNTEVVLCASHDTASAFESVDIDDNSLLLSSGTWSLIGVKINNPIVSELAKKYNFTNEGGIGYVRLLKNIMGLGIINNLQKELKISFDNIKKLAKMSAYKEIFDVNDTTFATKQQSSEVVVGLLSKTGKPMPKCVNALLNSVFHSLAYSYKKAVEEIEIITNKSFDKIVIVGGGAKNDYLNELTKEYTKKRIIVLPIEATAIGNIKVQMGVSNG